MFHLSYKLTKQLFDKQTPVIEPVASIAAISFPPEKIGSPGIRAAAVAQLNSFLDGIANKEACITPNDPVSSNVLMANELLALSKLVESGERVATARVFYEVDGPLIVIKLKG